jgi:hypothetical protein
LIEGQTAPALALFFTLDPQVDVPYHITHEHLSGVSLGSDRQFAKVLNLVLAVSDRRVLTRPVTPTLLEPRHAAISPS